MYICLQKYFCDIASEPSYKLSTPKQIWYSYVQYLARYELTSGQINF